MTDDHLCPICARTAPGTILATNTSALSVTELAKSEGITHPERVIGLHFFNPVHRMPLVEVIVTKHTSADVIATTIGFVQRLGKVPVVVKDSPGFIVNRILVPYLMEAVHLHETGVPAELIDEAMLSFGMPMGPIRLLDEVGLDVAAHVSKIMVDGYGERMAVPDFAHKLVALDRKGRKNNAGFYTYNGKESVPWDGLAEALGLPQKPSKGLSQREIADRLVLHLVNEAMKCLNEGVAGDDRELAKKQIDLGTVMGIGFPPFRGGPFRYVDHQGPGQVLRKLETMVGRLGARFAPAPLLVDVVKGARKFHTA